MKKVIIVFANVKGNIVYLPNFFFLKNLNLRGVPRGEDIDIDNFHEKKTNKNILNMEELASWDRIVLLNPSKREEKIRRLKEFLDEDCKIISVYNFITLENRAQDMLTRGAESYYQERKRDEDVITQTWVSGNISFISKEYDKIYFNEELLVLLNKLDSSDELWASGVPPQK